MPTYSSPVSVADLQTYLNDISTDPTLLAFYQTLLDTSTEYVYTWLDRDYTASAAKSDVFFGNETDTHRLHSAAETISSISLKSPLGDITTIDPADCLLFGSGMLLRLKSAVFEFDQEYTIIYHQPSSLSCPESVRQVILEHAAISFNESARGGGTLGEAISFVRTLTESDRLKYLDLSDRHQAMLRPYKRYPV